MDITIPVAEAVGDTISQSVCAEVLGSFDERIAAITNDIRVKQLRIKSLLEEYHRMKEQCVLYFGAAFFDQCVPCCYYNLISYSYIFFAFVLCIGWRKIPFGRRLVLRILSTSISTIPFQLLQIWRESLERCTIGVRRRYSWRRS